jgi:Kef-type K+ transport system membrane component KefB
MKILIAVVVLTVLALAGSRRALKPGRLPYTARMIFTGSEYIIIGLLLGSGFLNLIDELTLDRLRPFVCVALGWVGFLFGLQFDRRTLRHLPHGFLAIAVSIGVVTMVAVALPVWGLLGRSSEAPIGVVLLATITLAAAAACTGQAAVVLADRRSGPRSRHLMTLLRYISSLDATVGVVAFGIALSLYGGHPFGSASLPSTLQWLVISVALGLLTAWIFVSLTLTRTSQSELVLYLLGLVALASGVAFGLRVSVLFVSFVCGLMVANLAHVRSIRGRVMDLMVSSEHFLYLLLLVLAGACWRLPDARTLVAASAYVAARLIGKVVGAFVTTRRLRSQHRVPRLVGLGLASQGGMALAIIIEFWLAVDHPITQVVVGVAITAILINELAAPWLALWIAGRAQERSP